MRELLACVALFITCAEGSSTTVNRRLTETHPCDDGSHLCWRDDTFDDHAECHALDGGSYDCKCLSGYNQVSQFPHICQRTEYPTAFPTYSPTLAPTAAPTIHPCDDNTHQCWRADDGTDNHARCVATTGNSYNCHCLHENEYATISSYPHVCERTPAPTPSPTPSPTPQPTAFPTPQPTASPTKFPTPAPTASPTAFPTPQPTAFPTAFPTPQPTAFPTPQPTAFPTKFPTSVPTASPSRFPTSFPTPQPTASPTNFPTPAPTASPTVHPCTDGSHGCDKGPGGICYAATDGSNGWTCGCQSTHWCSNSCTAPHRSHTCVLITKSPTPAPTTSPTKFPTPAPTNSPTKFPTAAPTGSPTAYPTPAPTTYPTSAPTSEPTAYPTPYPTTYPTPSPTTYPTPYPTAMPTPAPTKAPTLHPCTDGSHGCDKGPGGICYPAADGSDDWSCDCQNTHWCSNGCTAPHTAHECTLITPAPTPIPTPSPTPSPTPYPTPYPTPSPTAFPTPSPTKTPTPAPTSSPTPAPTVHPCDDDSHKCWRADDGTGNDARCQATSGTEYSCHCLSEELYATISTWPHKCERTLAPTPSPTPVPTPAPTPFPTPSPTTYPTSYPSSTPTSFPTPYPTFYPTTFPTAFPTSYPSSYPTPYPTSSPTSSPTPHPCNDGSHECWRATDGSANDARCKTEMGNLFSCHCLAGYMEISKFPHTCERTNAPTAYPTPLPTAYPTTQPTAFPTPQPTAYPTPFPTPYPTTYPTPYPTTYPTPYPTSFPTPYPTTYPTTYPTAYPSSYPTAYPTAFPTTYPTPYPTTYPTPYPTTYPTPYPTSYPTSFPTAYPTTYPSPYPTSRPTAYPTPYPTTYPTPSPTTYPTPYPTAMPTPAPTKAPTLHPCTDGSHGCDKGPGGICYPAADGSDDWSCDCQNTHWCSNGCSQPHRSHTCVIITKAPTPYPTPYPTAYPTSQPTTYPTPYPTAYPTSQPTAYPTPYPTAYPTSQPTTYPTPYPTAYPTSMPTPAPTPAPTPEPIDCIGAWSTWGTCSRVCGNEGSWKRTFKVSYNAAHGGLPCEHGDDDSETRPCNRHKCGCSHLKCVFQVHAPTKRFSLQTYHMGKLEKWGTKHLCRNVKAGNTRTCHCVCGDPGKGVTNKEWTNHVHAEFIAKHQNKYMGYADAEHLLAAHGKARVKCSPNMEESVFGEGKGDHERGSAGTIVGNCEGITTAPHCRAGHLGSTPVTGHCDESQTRHPSHAPTPSPTAVDHDGWGNAKTSHTNHGGAVTEHGKNPFSTTEITEPADV